ncbi:MAG TPA: pyridoxamine 5'-phosphate oxidase family protein [Acidimicrobiales bacterium]|nr:pyridoxamine 5'-phosphate oxidase family protein [Acidimicrobiales bacterium]
MASLYHDGNRRLQDTFDTRRLADRLVEVTLSDAVGPREKAFIERQDMMFVATVDADGQPSCSYKGGDPGFVRVLDEHTLAFPNYDGNGMYLSFGNVLDTHGVGLLFVDFTRQSRVRVHGTASVDLDDPLLADYPEAQFVVRVAVTAVFPNCPRYIHHYELVERSSYVPRVEHETPTPEWKDLPWARDVLPSAEP